MTIEEGRKCPAKTTHEQERLQTCTKKILCEGRVQKIEITKS